MRRLYLKIYLTIIASLVLVVLVAGGVWRWGAGGPPGAQVFEIAGEIASLALPPATAPQAEQQRAIEHLAQRFRSDLALYTADGTLIAAAGRPLPPPPPNADGDWLRGRGGPAWAFRLPDDRRLVVRALPRHRNPAIGFLLVLGGIALAVAVVRLSVRARADAAAGAASGRRRKARRRQSRGPRRGRRQGRGGAARRELQPLRRAHRRADERAPHAARQRVARIAHAACRASGSASTFCSMTRPTRRRSSATSPSSIR